MFCPSCGAEYESGVEICGECKVALVSEEPDDELGFQETVKIFETTDAGEIALAESILQGAEIPYVVQNPLGQNILGGAVRDSAFASIEVAPEHAEDAAGLLDQLDDPIPEEAMEEYEDDDEDEED